MSGLRNTIHDLTFLYKTTIPFALVAKQCLSKTPFACLSCACRIMVASRTEFKISTTQHFPTINRVHCTSCIPIAVVTEISCSADVSVGRNIQNNAINSLRIWAHYRIEVHMNGAS